MKLGCTCSLFRPSRFNGLAALLEVVGLELVDMSLRCRSMLGLHVLHVGRELVALMLELSSCCVSVDESFSDCGVRCNLHSLENTSAVCNFSSAAAIVALARSSLRRLSCSTRPAWFSNGMP